jgi:hypothetical protein
MTSRVEASLRTEVGGARPKIKPNFPSVEKKRKGNEGANNSIVIDRKKIRQAEEAA